MNTTNISVGDAKSRFSELISRAASGERFVIHRRNRPIAALISTEELKLLGGQQKIAAEVARRLGKKASLVHAIETGQVHPLIAFYGAWPINRSGTALCQTYTKVGQVSANAQLSIYEDFGH